MPTPIYDPITKNVTDANGVVTTPAQAQAAFNVNNPITPETLAPAPPLDLPAQQPDTTNYQGIIGGGLEMANNLLKLNNKPPISEPTSLDQQLQSLLGSNQPESLTGAYSDLYGQSGIDQKQQDVISKQEATTQAQNEFNILNAQMQGLNAEAKVAPIQSQVDATGRGITAGGLAPIDTAKLRNIALRSLPLEGQMLAAQAKVSLAQGDQQNSQNILALAQQKFDQVFQLKSQDIQNQYNYKKDQQDKIWSYLTTKEQNQLTAQQKKDDQTYQEQRDNLTMAQNISKQALDNGQASIAGQITALDPKSPTFAADLATLQNKITSKNENALITKGWQYVATPAERDDLKKAGHTLQEVNGKTYVAPTKTVKTLKGGYDIVDSVSNQVVGGKAPVAGTSSGSTTFTKTQIQKLEQAGLKDAPRQQQLDFLYGKVNANEAKVNSYFDAKKGGDLKVSPQDWALAKEAWITDGGTATTFDTKFKGYKDPYNPNYN